MQAIEPGRVTSRQIEAARMAITRHVKRAGKLWIRVFPDRPVTKKPLEVRMGGGKGGVEEWAADVQPGRVMYEISGVDEKTAREAFRLAGHKLPVGYKFLDARSGLMKAKDLREKSLEDLRELEKSLARDVFQARFKNFTNRLDDTSSHQEGSPRRRSREDAPHRAREAAAPRRPTAARAKRPRRRARRRRSRPPQPQAEARPRRPRRPRRQDGEDQRPRRRARPSNMTENETQNARREAEHGRTASVARWSARSSATRWRRPSSSRS